MCILRLTASAQSHVQTTDKNDETVQNRTVKEIKEDKENFMDILLIGDEEETMVCKYLDIGNLYALYDSGILKSVCALIFADKTTVEIKNLATWRKFQNQGCASFLLEFIFKKYEGFDIILGTGENEKTLNFYKKRGFVEFSRIENFFIKNYPRPIIENGVQLKDMIYLRKKV